MRVSYQGNPVHKRNPGTFSGTEFTGLRQGKTLCDAAEIFDQDVALKLLQEGIRRGLISVQERNGWPQNAWAIGEKGLPLEAMLTNEQTGEYHGYPLQENDPLREDIFHRWEGR